MVTKNKSVKESSKKVVKKVSKKKNAKKDATKKTSVKRVSVNKNSVKKTGVESADVDRRLKKTGKQCFSLNSLSFENSAYAGVIAFFLSLMVAFMGTNSLDTMSQVIVFCIVGLFAGIFTVIYISGFVKLGSIIRNESMRLAALVFISLAVVDVIYLLMTSLMYIPRSSFAGFFFIVIYGIAAIVFGSSLYRLDSKFGTLAKFTGVMNILVGAFSVTIILAGIGVFLAVFTEILNILVLFKASRVLR